MLFNSIEYLLFLPLTFLVYWSLKNKLIYQNLFLLIASYFFYGLWDYRFLSLIIISSFTDYIIGKQIHKQNSDKTRKMLLGLSLLVNLGFLAVFKYCNFFINSFVDLLNLVGMQANYSTLKIVLPVGISFYTFQTLSYTIDIYKKKLEPSENALNFFTYVAFFPQLVAGPIERASQLLPQIEQKRTFNQEQSIDGLRQILWGLFKKVVIADNCALFVNKIFAGHAELSGMVLWLGGFLFVMQIYCDFSGYTDVAIGTAKLLGINLMQNFSTPYFSVNTTDLWRRWHISLSTWFRDYVFNPIALHFRNLGVASIYISTFITFLIIGLWHGGNWTFVFFGLLQAIALSLEIMTQKRRKKFKKKKKFLKPYYFFSWLLTMLFWLFVCIIFRSENITSFYKYFVQMFQPSAFNITQILAKNKLEINTLYYLFIGISFIMLVEYLNRKYEHGLFKVPANTVLRMLLYGILIHMIFFNFNEYQEFIYFQF